MRAGAPAGRAQGSRPTDAASSPSAAKVARRLLAERRRRDRALGADLFGEPAWDILLLLFAAGEERLRYSVSDICMETPAPTTTAHRWLVALIERGLLVRVDDPRDGRRSHVYLSPDARRAMLFLLCGHAGADA